MAIAVAVAAVAVPVALSLAVAVLSAVVDAAPVSAAYRSQIPPPPTVPAAAATASLPAVTLTTTQQLNTPPKRQLEVASAVTSPTMTPPEPSDRVPSPLAATQLITQSNIQF